MALRTKVQGMKNMKKSNIFVLILKHLQNKYKNVMKRYLFNLIFLGLKNNKY